MSLEFRLGDLPDRYGNHFIIGLSGTTLSNQDKENLKRVKPLGVMLLARNFLKNEDSSPLGYDRWIKALTYLLSETHKYAEREKMIVSIDHEGGRVHRTPPPIAHFPSASRYCRQAKDVAAVMGQQLASLGVNVVFGPCADIHSNPDNPVIGPRAFGTNPERVSESVLDFMTGLGTSTVLPCIKHFPGHGDTEKDSHLELPILNSTTEQLLQRECRPFEAAIAAGVPMIMTAHILFPKIDPKKPATMSK
jgi:beta-N-acetylhexosaminidase